jgi:cytochrome oxidase Cu insertion factor (SCO1/SenC/PrrC family)
LTVCQAYGHKDIYVFYKGGSEYAIGKDLNDSCVIYDIPIREPFRVAIVDDSTHRIRPIWIDPRLQKNRSVTINNRTGEMIKHDTISMDIDDAPNWQIQMDYTAGKISTQDSFIILMNAYEESYLIAHPDSFLAVTYLHSILNHIDLNKMIKYRDMVRKNNSQYEEFKFINSYIENYKYKSVPHVGDAFMEFQCKKVDGGTFDSKTISDKAIVIFFWYSGCGPCHRAIEPLRSVYDKYKSKGLEVISFSLDNTQEEWAKSSATFKPVGIDVSDLIGFSSPLFLHYSVSAFPFFVIFDREKKISMVTFGEDEVPLIESKIKELLNTK